MAERVTLLKSSIGPLTPDPEARFHLHAPRLSGLRALNDEPRAPNSAGTPVPTQTALWARVPPEVSPRGALPLATHRRTPFHLCCPLQPSATWPLVSSLPGTEWMQTEPPTAARRGAHPSKRGAVAQHPARLPAWPLTRGPARQVPVSLVGTGPWLKVQLSSGSDRVTATGIKNTCSY